MGAAYVDFALAKPGMFRLMFSPMLSARRDDEELAGRRQRSVRHARPRRRRARRRRRRRPEIPAAAIAAWSLVHGLSHLILDGVLPKSEAEAFKRAILAPPAGEPPVRGQRRPDMAERAAMTDLRAALIIIALPEMAG